MSLRESSVIPFAYKEKQKVIETNNGMAVFEFKGTVYLHSLSIYANNDVDVIVSIVFPTSFTQGGDSSAFRIFSGRVGNSGLLIAPGAISRSPVTPTSAYAPLPSVFPEGSLLFVEGSYVTMDADMEVFLVASG